MAFNKKGYILNMQPSSHYNIISCYFTIILPLYTRPSDSIL